MANFDLFRRDASRFFAGMLGLLMMPMLVAPALAEQQGSDAKPLKAAADAPPPAAGDAGLKSRVEALEEQLVDMQVVIGTLESLAKNGGLAPAAFPAAAA